MMMNDAVTGSSLFYAPGLGEMEPHVWEAMQNSELVLVDGTMWTDDEMIMRGASAKTARSMGHLPQSGPGGMLEWLDKLPTSTRKILIHINNTNPILDEDSEERSVLALHGIEVAYDGLELKIQENAGTMTMDTPPWSRDEFERRLREQGQAYHIHHPFNVMLNTGQATPEQIRGWVANRFCYQVAILSGCGSAVQLHRPGSAT